jgi:dolichol-phosphate hexosyltransferase
LPTSENIINNEILMQNQFYNQIDRSEVTVIVPTLNEEQSIGLVLKDLQLEGYVNILVVDGDSADKTVQNAKKYNVQIIQQKGKGKAGAIKTAIEHINTPYLVLIDADSTYNPNEIDRILEKAPHYNQVIGARQDRINIKKINRFGNNLINGLFNFFFGTHLKDVCSGMYSLKTNFAKEMNLKSEGFDIEVEIAAYSSSFNSIKEVPISYNKRIGMQKLNSLRDGFKIIFSILDLARKLSPIIFYSLMISVLMTLVGTVLFAMSYSTVFNGINFPLVSVLGPLIITTGVQFLILSIILSQLNYFIKNNVNKNRKIT